MQLDAAVFKHGIVRGKVGFAPGAMTVVIMTVSSTACAAAESTTSSRSVVLAVRHVTTAASKTGEVLVLCRRSTLAPLRVMARGLQGSCRWCVRNLGLHRSEVV
jgi:hypothetical protein